MMRKWKEEEEEEEDYKGNPTQIGQFTIRREVTNLVQYPCP